MIQVAIMIHWLGHASIQLEGTKTIYIDPWEIKSGPVADLILITHEHYDHCSAPDVKKISGPHTKIVAPADCALKLGGTVTTLKPGATTLLQGVKVEAVPAYNVNKQFHPKANNWVGYIVTLDGQRIYHAGDTDLIPEMRKIKADTALLPIGGTYTMTAEEAAQACEWLKVTKAIPMHYGKIVGTAADAEKFKQLCKVPVTILPKSAL